MVAPARWAALVVVTVPVLSAAACWAALVAAIAVAVPSAVAVLAVAALARLTVAAAALAAGTGSRERNLHNPVGRSRLYGAET